MSEKRMSIIDGSLEAGEETGEKIPRVVLVPIFKEIVDTILTLDGLEEIVRKVLVGFKEEK